MKNLKYSEILRLNKEIETNLTEKPYNITILSNITIHQVKEVLEYSLRSKGVNGNVFFGDYDNIVQDSLKYNDSNTVIIFWELCNIIDGFQFKIELLSDDELSTILEKVKSEIDFVLKNLEATSLVIINKFTSLHFSNSNIRKNNLEKFSNSLNQYIENKAPENVRLCNVEKIIAQVGLKKSVDLRYFYSSKALYTVDFFKAYANYSSPFIMSASGKAKKALIFDCDNTLWKGILGEDGFDNIEMSRKTKDGTIFSEIQAIALALNKQGILICLCSKNNFSDVDQVIQSHPDMQLRNEYITINKSNWSDKVSNLKEISQELNIGLDSLLFVDDSSFEVNLIKEQLPEVSVLQVPKRLYNYPKMLREKIGLFYNLSFTAEDRNKIDIYKQQVTREITKSDYSSIEDYLTSLGLRMRVHLDDDSIVPRMSQMSQKTNQFNLTTKRYTEGDIKNFVASSKYHVLAFSVTDKFGDSGVTGLCILNLDEDIKSAEIDTFLMSCRIIGRNLEHSFMDYIIDILKRRKVNSLRATYIKTKKNEQVKNFYESCSFVVVESKDAIKSYAINLDNYNPKRLKYISVADTK